MVALSSGWRGAAEGRGGAGDRRRGRRTSPSRFRRRGLTRRPPPTRPQKKSRWGRSASLSAIAGSSDDDVERGQPRRGRRRAPRRGSPSSLIPQTRCARGAKPPSGGKRRWRRRPGRALCTQRARQRGGRARPEARRARGRRRRAARARARAGRWTPRATRRSAGSPRLCATSARVWSKRRGRCGWRSRRSAGGARATRELSERRRERPSRRPKKRKKRVGRLPHDTLESQRALRAATSSPRTKNPKNSPRRRRAVPDVAGFLATRRGGGGGGEKRRRRRRR